ncbi:hypothetical protein VNO77_20412 [Canavalia gladiata]|uniref:Uncharacterized protein n=1 Tax=Canavalia gladiata TaxID=3824 RepID=A0AAN9LP64_CANGL
MVLLYAQIIMNLHDLNKLRFYAFQINFKNNTQWSSGGSADYLSLNINVHWFNQFNSFHHFSASCWSQYYWIRIRTIRNNQLRFELDINPVKSTFSNNILA